MVTAEEIEAARTPKGGWTRAQLAEWGVPWPPPKGWRKRLIEEAETFSCDDCPMADPGDCLKAGYCHHRDQDKWREAYRSQDSSGSPLSAGAVGWAWIEALGKEAKATVEDPGALCIETCPLDTAGATITLFYGSKPLAVATIFRDQMNFAVLVRWRAPE